MLENFYEKAMDIYTQGKNRIELHKARTQFFEWAGQFDEASNDFEVKMSLFTDWYLLDRPHVDGVAPINMLTEIQNDFSEDHQKIIAGLQKSEHSLFEFIKLKKENIYIKNLFTGQKYLISDFKILSAFSKEQFFEARILEYGDKLIFTGSFCFHPPQACKYILKEIKLYKKTVKKENEEVKLKAKYDLINKLFRMKYRTEQYKHIKIEEIYSNNAKVKI